MYSPRRYAVSFEARPNAMPIKFDGQLSFRPHPQSVIWLNGVFFFRANNQMSTGDQTAYLRSKLAQRRDKLDYGGPGGQWSSPPQFMKDGFNQWAESSAPARHGGAEKCGCEKESLRGRGVVDDIKQGIGALPDGEFKTGLQNVVKFGEKAVPYAKAAKGLLKNTGVKALAREIGGPAVVPVMDKIVEYMELVGLGHMKGA